jgi:hypothetical protein
VLIPARLKIPDFVLRGIRGLKRGYSARIHHWAFDTETVDGDPVMIQFAGRIRGEVQGWCRPVTRTTILDALMDFLMQWGDAGHTNILWSHVSEYDLGVAFVEFPEIWEHSRWDADFQAGKSGEEVARIHLRHFDNPYHDVHLGRTHWRLLDTFSWFKKGLDKIAEELQLPTKKMARPDYIGKRKPETKDEKAYFEAYAINDAITTLHLGEFIAGMHDELDIPMSISIAHMASHVFRKQFLNEPLVETSTPGYVVRHRMPHAHPNADYEMLPGTEKRLPLEIPEQSIPFPFLTGNASPELYHASMYSYHGGKNGLYVPPGIYGNVREVDIISAYPTAMKALPPMTKGDWVATDEFIITNPFGDPPVPEWAGIYRVSGHVGGRCPYGTFMDHTGEVKFKAGDVFTDTWVTGWELASCWGEINVDDLFGYIWVPSAGAINPFDHYVDFFFEKKNSTPKEDPRYQMYKLLLNALYGKLIQRADEEDQHGQLITTAGMLFNPFWASQITGHCRARLHQLEHTYSAIHSSTDSILTQSSSISTGHGLGDLEVKAEGTLTVLRNKLYILKAGEQIEKFALHGFRGRVADLEALIKKGGKSYSVMHMWRPRESRRQDQKPFRMTEREFSLHLPQEVWDAVNPNQRKGPHHGWQSASAG